MAKKPSTSKKKPAKKAAPVPPAPKQASPFWAYAAAIVLMLLAVFVLLGGFNTGGNLPVGLFEGFASALGWAAYLAPVALGYWGIYKFSSEDHKLPLGKLLSLVAALVFAAALMCTMFATKEATGLITGGYGGTVGNGLGGLVLGALDMFPASLLLFALTVLAGFFAFGLDFGLLLKPFQNIGRSRPAEAEGGELGALKASAAARDGFSVNQGVPFETKPPADEKPRRAPLRLSSLKNTAPAPTAAEASQTALTAATDPNWQFPPVAILNQKQDKANAGDVNGNAQSIKDTFTNFNIEVEMEGANVGPRVTQYTMRPPTGVKLTRITALENNLALDLAATSIRMEAPIPGKRAVGIEVPNLKAATVRISSLLTSDEFRRIDSPLGFAIGRDIGGQPVVRDLAKMPHLLVAGQTGSGKSVMINTILTSMLYRSSPSDLKMILVDPKQVELTPYNNVPHLLTPVINEPEKCISALKWAVAEMERRLKAMAEVGRRNIGEYNNLKKEEGMPYIVIVIDELADLMMMAARDVESLIVRLAQKARAAGIHLILATQRPSVDVITGLIKANIPARIAFTVASQVDSRTIIDQMGAEKLLGQGDMLLLTSDMPKPVRVQGAFISDDETLKVTKFITDQAEPSYNDEVVSQPVQLNGKGGVVPDTGPGSDSKGDIFKDAVQVVIDSRKASTSLLQRRLSIGYGRAAGLMDQMEEQGIISSSDGSNRPRDVLVNSVDEVFGTAGDDSQQS